MARSSNAPRRRLAAAAVAAALVVPEAVHFAASLAPTPPAGRRCVVLALGYPGRRDGRPGAVQRYRMRRAVEAYQRFVCEKIVVSGGAVRGGRAEADAMAELAESADVPRERIVRERQARSTWENVSFALALAPSAESWIVVSDAVHARRGRRYLCRQAPELCPRTYIYSPYRPLEAWWMKAGGLLLEGRAWLRDRQLY